MFMDLQQRSMSFDNNIPFKVNLSKGKTMLLEVEKKTPIDSYRVHSSWKWMVVGSGGGGGAAATASSTPLSSYGTLENCFT